MPVRRPLRTSGDRSTGYRLLGIFLAVVIVLGLLWFIFGGRTAPTTTATPGGGIEVPTTPPPTTPITPRAPK